MHDISTRSAVDRVPLDVQSLSIARPSCYLRLVVSAGQSCRRLPFPSHDQGARTHFGPVHLFTFLYHELPCTFCWRSSLYTRGKFWLFPHWPLRDELLLFSPSLTSTGRTSLSLKSTLPLSLSISSTLVPVKRNAVIEAPVLREWLGEVTPAIVMFNAGGAGPILPPRAGSSS